jgi:hypothetical protein
VIHIDGGVNKLTISLSSFASTSAMNGGVGWIKNCLDV